ncbi:MAG: hypothetical protein ACTSRZ_02885 [Promethearchaeota archaeon]
MKSFSKLKKDSILKRKKKKKNYFKFTLVILFLGIWILNLSLFETRGFTNKIDSLNDIKALKLSDSYEIINISEYMGFIDIVNLKWNNDSNSLNISLEFASNVDSQKIYNGSVFGWIVFKNSTSLDPAQNPAILKVSFSKNKSASQINGTAIIFDVNQTLTYINCAIIDGKYINWTIPSEFLLNSSIINQTVNASNWYPLCFVVYIKQSGDIIYIYWDTISFTSYYDEIWDNLADIIGKIDGFSLFIIMLINITIIVVIIIRIKYKDKNRENRGK